MAEENCKLEFWRFDNEIVKKFSNRFGRAFLGEECVAVVTKKINSEESYLFEISYCARGSNVVAFGNYLEETKKRFLNALYYALCSKSNVKRQQGRKRKMRHKLSRLS